MKLGRNKKDLSAAKPARNNSKKTVYVVATIIITGLLIFWVFTMGRKAEETIPVAMLSQSVYKNQVITEDVLVKYDMLKGEFDKYAVEQEDGTKKRRILLWEEKDKIINSFAAYPLQKNTVAMYRDFIKSRVDNSDSVLYSFPGKNIVEIDVAETDLQAFKTFLEPGDRININCIYSQVEQVAKDDGEGGTIKESVEVFKEETPFKDVMIADLTNQKGDSILDIYASYNEKTVYQQAQLDSSADFIESVTPKSLFIAFTPQEEERYYYYLGKESVEFRISLPQRVE